MKTHTKAIRIPAPLDPNANLAQPILDRRAKDYRSVTDAIKDAAGRATNHTHTTMGLCEDAHRMFRKLRKYVPACHLVGCKIVLSSQPSLPRAYGNRQVIHTVATVSIRRGGLFLEKVERVEQWATSSPAPAARGHLTPAARDRMGSSLFEDATTI